MKIQVGLTQKAADDYYVKNGSHARVHEIEIDETTLTEADREIVVDARRWNVSCYRVDATSYDLDEIRNIAIEQLTAKIDAKKKSDEANIERGAEKIRQFLAGHTEIESSEVIDIRQESIDRANVDRSQIEIEVARRAQARQEKSRQLQEASARKRANLENWARIHGSDLLKKRLDLGQNWVSLARLESAQAELGEADFRDHEELTKNYAEVFLYENANLDELKKLEHYRDIAKKSDKIIQADLYRCENDDETLTLVTLNVLSADGEIVCLSRPISE